MNCFYCHEPLTSNDYKLDRIVHKVGLKDFVAHRTCKEKRLNEIEKLIQKQNAIPKV